MERETLLSIMKLYGINPVVRDEGTLHFCLEPNTSGHTQAWLVSHKHPFMDGNKRAAFIILVGEWLKVLEDI